MYEKFKKFLSLVASGMIYANMQHSMGGGQYINGAPVINL